MRRRLRAYASALLLATALAPALGHALAVFACEPEWAALATELGGTHVEVITATTAYQDPHYLQARPSLLAGARRADLLVCTGAELEVGWLPLLLRRAGNAAIQPAMPGHFMAADFVRKLEIPTRLDRAQGDVHPQGNPHVHLNPHNIARIAAVLSQRLIELDPAAAEAYGQRFAAFDARWSEAIVDWEAQAAPLAGMRLVAHHRSFTYLADWLDLDIVATLEPKPGIPPSGAHLSKLLAQLASAPPRAVIRAPFANEKPAAWLSERLQIPVVVLPFTVGGDPRVTDLYTLFEVTLADLEALVP